MKSSSPFARGFRDAFPVFVSYLSVSIALGISCRNAGMGVLSSGLMSFLNLTSAGQYAGIRIISEHGTYLEILLSQLAINIRYFLMSAVLASRLSESVGTGRRLLMGIGVTDEIFGLSAAQKNLDPMYTFGCYCMSVPGWIAGTLIGVVIGNSFPQDIVNALSIALYGMFIAIIIPPARRNRTLFPVIAVSMVLSCLMERFIRSISFGMRVVILTVAISAMAAVLFPVEDEDAKEETDG